MVKTRRRFLSGALAGWAAACAPAGRAAPARVFAAASLTQVVQAAAQAFGPVRVETFFAASSLLARQIEAGAPADVFLSADQRWMEALLEKRVLAAETVRILATNRLVLVASVAAPPTLQPPLRDLAAALGAGRLALADPAHVPAGRYSEAALRSLGHWPAVQDRLIPAANVRAALTLVARKEAPLGIVYHTDAVHEPRVRVVATLPESAHPRIVYPGALSQTAGSTGRAFLDALGGPSGRALFARFGFGPP
jgi:molybdate transport system substrate-binding protein